MKALAAATLLVLAGCATKPTVDLSKIQASLRTPCAEWVELKEGTGKAVVIWGTITKKNYDECVSRHKRLVEAIESQKTE